MFDSMLKTTFELALITRRRDASDRMRAFIFQNLTDFKRGRIHDIGELTSQYIDKCSQHFKNIFIIRRQRINQCPYNQQHVCFLNASTDPFSAFTHVIEPNPSALMKANVLNGSPQEFINFFAKRLLKLREDSTCLFCQKTATTYYLPTHDLPPFLFIRDNSFSFPEDVGTISFPYDMPLQFNNYRLIAMISSTERHGHHFRTTAVINMPCNGPFIASMDNMKRPGIKVMSEKHEEFGNIFAKIKYPVLACYQKT